MCGYAMCRYTMCEHAMCEHAMCGYTMCEYAMCEYEAPGEVCHGCHGVDPRQQTAAPVVLDDVLAGPAAGGYTEARRVELFGEAVLVVGGLDGLELVDGLNPRVAGVRVGDALVRRMVGRWVVVQRQVIHLLTVTLLKRALLGTKACALERRWPQRILRGCRGDGRQTTRKEVAVRRLVSSIVRLVRPAVVHLAVLDACPCARMHG